MSPRYVWHRRRGHCHGHRRRGNHRVLWNLWAHRLSLNPDAPKEEEKQDHLQSDGRAGGQGRRSWDPECRKLQKEHKLGRETWPAPSSCPLPCQLPSPTCGLTVFSILASTIIRGDEGADGDSPPWPWQLSLQQQPRPALLSFCSSPGLLSFCSSPLPIALFILSNSRHIPSSSEHPHPPAHPAHTVLPA